MEIVKQENNIIHSPVVNDIELTATIPEEMVSAQHNLISWCELKLKVLSDESEELKDAYEHAKKMKWKTSALLNQYSKSVKRIQYYEKIKAALIEGYYIIPNFPIDIFAIKTNRKEPSGKENSYWATFEQKEVELPMAEGVYRNPLPLTFHQNSYKDSSGKDIPSRSWADSWQDIDFPISMAKPQIMEITSNAMAKKIFDRIGIMPQSKKGDPIIIGQIINKSGYNTKTVSFMIAWHLNTNVL